MAIENQSEGSTQSAVIKMLDVLQERAGCCLETTKEFVKRLEPVLSSATLMPKATGDEKKPETTPLGTRMSYIHQMLVSSNEILVDCLRRLEI